MAKKTIKKPAKPAAKKSVKKMAKKAAKKIVKKSAKAAAKKVANKMAKKPIKPAKNKLAKKPVAKVKKAAPAKATKTHVSWQKFLTPLEDRILLKAEGVAERTPGGLYIPETVRERANQARVLAVGPGKRDKKGRLKPLDVRVGDRVLMPDFYGQTIAFAGDELLIVRESEIVGIFDSK